MQAQTQVRREPVTDTAHSLETTRARVRKIESIIEGVRPALQRDGGDCELVEVEGNRVMVRLKGQCMFCRLSAATLEGIQSRIVEELGELVRLIPVQGGVPS